MKTEKKEEKFYKFLKKNNLEGLLMLKEEKCVYVCEEEVDACIK